jgi:hypothetical protein
MSRIATDRYKSLHELTPSQTLALDVLDRGGTHAEAADVAGVDRTTVSRWATQHPAFVAELNRRKTERAERNARRIEELTLVAIENVGVALANGDLGTSMQWLKTFGVGSITDQPLGPTTVAAFIEARRNRLPTASERVFQVLDENAGATIEAAEEAILADLGEVGQKRP